MLQSCPQIGEDDVSEHVYSLYTDRAPVEGQNLGYVDRSKDHIEIVLPESALDLHIRQSISSLSSKTQTSSTGFICWQTALLIADWILSDNKCLPRRMIEDRVVLELGTGVSALLASTIGPLCSHYICSDQKHLLKLMKLNFGENVVTQRYTTSTGNDPPVMPSKCKDIWPKIDFIELDWESPEWGASELERLSGKKCADVVIACDTVYNSYLVPYFIETVKSMMSFDSVAVVAMQLRDESVLEDFLYKAIDVGLEVRVIADEALSAQLRRGFVVYCMRLKGVAS